MKGDQVVTVDHVWALAAALDVQPIDLLPIDDDRPATDRRWARLHAAVDAGSPDQVLAALEQLGVHLPTGKGQGVADASRQLLVAADAVSLAADSLRAAAQAIDPAGHNID